MKPATRQLVSLAVLALLFYGFAVAADSRELQTAFGVCLALGVIFECRFWWRLLFPKKSAPALE
ncbi:MAG: hypothetical protein AAF560_02650 [Acidobacteriota bacterium]